MKWVHGLVFTDQPVKSHVIRYMNNNPSIFIFFFFLLCVVNLHCFFFRKKKKQKKYPDKIVYGFDL